jgi:hypothetical protein
MSRKVAVSISGDAIKFSNGHNPSSRIMVMGSTQPVREISTTNISGGKGWPAGA